VQGGKSHPLRPVEDGVNLPAALPVEEAKDSPQQKRNGRGIRWRHIIIATVFPFGDKFLTINPEETSSALPVYCIGNFSSFRRHKFKHFFCLYHNILFA
jgi:hypothetical protein